MSRAQYTFAATLYNVVTNRALTYVRNREYPELGWAIRIEKENKL